LIASPFATGVAEATVVSDDVPATNTIVATSFVKRLAILLSPGVSPCDESYYGPMADQCAIRSGREVSKRQISSVLWNLGDRPEQVGGPVRASGKRRNPVSGSTYCKAWAAGLTGCAIDARPRQTKQ
jgi:hypothetical protein